MNPKWEYRVFQMNGSGDIEKSLNEVGEKGWEVAAVGVQFNQHFIYLKRQRRDGQ